MIDIKFLRENPDAVKENIKKKFQDNKLELVDKVIELDAESRAVKQQADELRSNRNKISKQIGALMAQGKKEEGMALKDEVTRQAQLLSELEEKETKLSEQVTEIMMQIPQMIDKKVPIGKDDSQNVEIERFGEPVVPDYEIPYHTEIMEKLNGIDLDSARKVAGNGFYYLMGDIARLHSAVISYARDFMIDRGFTYCVPPFMIRSNVVTGVMSFAEMDSMMYKIEGEDLYLIGTSEHSMIGKFIDTINKEENLPYTLTSYSPCFRKEKGAHGIEERGVYRIHQFEKQEMIVVCKPEESEMWFDKLWQNTVDLFRSMDIPVRTLECCSGDLADLKVRSLDVEAWSPRQKKYFEVGSCSNLGDAQARRLKIRVSGEGGKKYFAHTLNNTVVAPPRMLIAFLENNLNEDGSVNIPVALRPYMGGKEVISAR
ncbi:serine--tRNA ligase [Ruminococcus sp.]|uniref:serine--tRNA ligase n=1 Tax=Ruminococcus sp. TaxID=41978 RepID=UPI0026081440|nr:serine--tRNA ligase [Ruminococcus sp.]MDD6988050.1 serine--tRNA ligase [Ruminococcus sp.]MDY6202053.1 serine--tRNA ligase [Ruminococcus sp.]